MPQSVSARGRVGPGEPSDRKAAAELSRRGRCELPVASEGRVPKAAVLGPLRAATAVLGSPSVRLQRIAYSRGCDVLLPEMVPVNAAHTFGALGLRP